MNIAEDLAGLAARQGWTGLTAFHTEDRAFSHGDVHESAAKLATVLAGYGVGVGERVLVALPDGIGFVTAFLAVARLGAVAVTVNPALPAGELGLLGADCEAGLVISASELADAFTEVSWADVDVLLAEAADAPPAAAAQVDPSAALYVQYTSGTTGQPKSVPHRHGDLPVYHRNAGETVLRLKPGDVGFSISRMYFAYGFGNSFVYPLYSGSSAVLTRQRPTPETVTRVVREHGVSVLYGVPSAFANLLATEFAGETLRLCVSAGEPLTPALGVRITERLRCPVLNGLGSTELGGFCAITTPESPAPGTVGRPLPDYRLDVRDDEGRSLPDGVPGSLWVHGPTVTADGWLHTGDRATRQIDGSFVLSGRDDDLELVGGITISPHEVEEALGAHPAVAEVVVAAVADRLGASKLRAFVVPADRELDTASIQADLLELARTRLSAFKVPRSVEFVEALPRTHTGKVRRFVVRRGRW